MLQNCKLIVDVISNLQVKHGCKLPAVISFWHVVCIVRECCHLKAEESRKRPPDSPALWGSTHLHAA